MDIEDNNFSENELINYLDNELKTQKEINFKTKEYLMLLESVIEDNKITVNFNEKRKKDYADNSNILDVKYDNLLKSNEELKRENEELKRAINVYKNSNSWKITKPLRSLMKIFKKK